MANRRPLVSAETLKTSKRVPDCPFPDSVDACAFASETGKSLRPCLRYLLHDIRLGHGASTSGAHASACISVHLSSVLEEH